MPIRHLFIWLAALSMLYGCAETRKPELKEVACLGHRGQVTDDTLENTHQAFQAAYNIGADGIELDVFHTRDNVAVVFHDQTLNRLARSKAGHNCPLDQGVADLGFQDLKQRCQLINGDDIPTLESVFQRYGSTRLRLHIEFKDPVPKRTLRLAQTYYPEPGNRLQATSFLKDVLTTAAAVNPQNFPLLLAHRRYIPGMEYGFDGVDVASISTTAIRRLHKAGKRIGLYDMNNATDIRRALAERVHYITTDNLPLCLRLKQEALHEQS